MFLKRLFEANQSLKKAYSSAEQTIIECLISFRIVTPSRYLIKEIFL